MPLLQLMPGLSNQQWVGLILLLCSRDPDGVFNPAHLWSHVQASVNECVSLDRVLASLNRTPHVESIDHHGVLFRYTLWRHVYTPL